MLTLVQIKKSAASSTDAASLMTDYLAFDRRRASRRQYLKAFGGMAIIVLLGAAFGRVPADQAEIVAAMLLVVPLTLSVIEGFHWLRLARRLNRLRAEVQSVRKL